MLRGATIRVHARLGELDDSPLVHDSCPNNYLIKREYQRGEVDEAFHNAHAVVKRKFKIGRKQALCLEGRGCVAGYRENTFTLTVWMSHQLPYVVRHYLAKRHRLAWPIPARRAQHGLHDSSHARAVRFPFVPAHISVAAMEAAIPIQMVDTSGVMYCIVS
jgi:CO/xanthine dehydrogenase Mo-binding subunit